jgi:putative ABC transport system permease protein
MLENIRLSFQGIWGHKLRSLLTMLGVIIGIASIIAIVSTIKGTNEQIKQNLVGAGNNVVTVSLAQGGYSVDMSWTTLPAGIPVISDEVRDQIASLSAVENVSLYTERTYTSDVYYLNTAFSGTVRGVDLNYLSVYGYSAYLGRGFVESDFTEYRKVVLLDQKAANALFAGENPIGKKVEIGSEPYTVVGLVALNSEYEPVINSLSDYYLYSGSESGTIFLPNTMWPAVYRYDEPQNVAVRCTTTDDMTTVGQATADILNNNLQVSEDSDFAYQSEDVMEQAKQLQELASNTNVQLLWIAGISLLVGGIGVMNIMLVTVTERTKEIGLKKAIGAKKSRILWQFLTEAAVLTCMGGILGVIAGIVMSKVISQITQAPTAISVGAILIAVAFSTLIGVVFGLIPAVKASNLSPIEALRRE